MASRRRYLVAYDIRSPERLRRVHDTMCGYGTRMQYSVFIADLTGTERVRMIGALTAIIDSRVDSVMILDLGDSAAHPNRYLHLIGPHPALPRPGRPAIY